MTAAHPTETHRLFGHDRVAAGYASARPCLHPEIFAVVRDVVRPAAAFRRALDVGCGTGLSSRALLDLSREVVGIDVIAAIEYGSEAEDGVRAWLESELLSLFGGGSRPVAFSGYVQALRRC